jgi:hypothetical protein
MKTLIALTFATLAASTVTAAPVIRDISSLTAPSARYQGEGLDSRFGRGMDFVGDLNGDGLDDLAVGAHRTDLDAGKVYVIFGSTAPTAPSAGRPGNLNGSNGFTIVGPSANADAGFAVSAAGDFNGDGRPDMVISSTTETNNTASVYVIFGRASYPATISLANPPAGFGFRVTQQFGPGTFGWSLSATDLNDDGFSDVLISNWTSSQLLVVFGQAAAPNALTDISALSTTSSPRGVRFVDADNGSRFGWSVRGGFDVNGDGIDDMLVGAPFSNNQNGRFNVIYGRANVGGNLAFSAQESVSVFTANQGMQFTAGATQLQGGRLGTSVEVADINGDAFVDFIAGAQSANPFGQQSGAVYTVYGTGGNSTTFSRDVSTVINAGGGMVLGGADNGDATGTVVSAPGDIDGDGLNDLVVGAHVAGSGKGRFYVVYGRPDWPALTLMGNIEEGDGHIWVGTSLNASSSLGFSTARAGDFNGDGRADVAVGALLANGQGGAPQAAGTAYLLLINRRPLCDGFEALRCR